MAPESLPDAAVASTGGQSCRSTIAEAFAFDDVLLVPAYSAVLPTRPTPAPASRAIPLTYPSSPPPWTR